MLIVILPKFDLAVLGVSCELGFFIWFFVVFAVLVQSVTFSLQLF